MTGYELTALFAARMPWDRGYLQPVTTQIEYDADGPVRFYPVTPVAEDSAVSFSESQMVGEGVENKKILRARHRQPVEDRSPTARDRE